MRPKMLSWEEALRLNGTEGYRPSDALADRAKALASLASQRSSPERHWVILKREDRSCDRHGPYTANLEELTPTVPVVKPFWTKCPACDSEIAEEQRTYSASAAEAKKAMDQLRLVNAGIPERNFGSSFENFQHRIPAMDRAWHALRSYAWDFQSGLESGRCAILHGTHGAGKTHLAVAVLRHVLLKLGGTGKYLTQGRFISRLKATMDKGAGENEDAVYKALASVDLLVLDEIGRGSASSWERSALFRLLDERYQQRCKPTVLVTNLSLSELAAEVDSAGIDRMRENGGIRVHFNWESQRIAKPEADA